MTNENPLLNTLYGDLNKWGYAKLLRDLDFYNDTNLRNEVVKDGVIVCVRKHEFQNKTCWFIVASSSKMDGFITCVLDTEKAKSHLKSVQFKGKLMIPSRSEYLKYERLFEDLCEGFDLTNVFNP